MVAESAINPDAFRRVGLSFVSWPLDGDASLDWRAASANDPTTNFLPFQAF
jgi:hypothetical protein